jgi:hypothetical protein
VTIGAAPATRLGSHLLGSAVWYGEIADVVEDVAAYLERASGRRHFIKPSNARRRAVQAGLCRSLRPVIVDDGFVRVLDDAPSRMRPRHPRRHGLPCAISCCAGPRPGRWPNDRRIAELAPY